MEHHAIQEFRIDETTDVGRDIRHRDVKVWTLLEHRAHDHPVPAADIEASAPRRYLIPDKCCNFVNIYKY